MTAGPHYRDDILIWSDENPSHTLKHTLVYLLFDSKWDHNLENQHHAVVKKKKKVETNDWDHKLIRKLFTEVINQVRSKAVFS